MKRHHEHLIDYYEAFENLLTYNRQSLGEYRTHFGYMTNDDPNYCWFRAVTQADRYPDLFSEVLWSMDQMHQRIFPADLNGRRVLDVGFGTAGTLKMLARDNPQATIEGINLNPMQFHIARDYLNDTPNAFLHLGDIYQYPLPGRYDLLYFIESAFHMPDKAGLVARIADLLEPGGEAYIVDIFYPEALWQRIGGRRTNEAIFDYQSISAWEKQFARHRMQVESYDDISPQVGRHLTIQMSEEEFVDAVLAPILRDNLKADIYRERLLEAFRGYKRLGRILSKSSMQYGILKVQKA